MVKNHLNSDKNS